MIKLVMPLVILISHISNKKSLQIYNVMSFFFLSYFCLEIKLNENILE